MGASGAMYGAMGTSAIGALGSAYSQAQATKARGDYASAVANTNARIANLEADQTIAAGDVAASRKNLETRQVVGSIKATQGASGIDVSTGSSAHTRISTEFAGKMDEMTIRNNAARQAWGFKVQAMNDSFEGQMTKMTASNQAQQTLLTGGLQAIEGPLSIYANYKRWSSHYGGGSGFSLPFDMSTATG